jgi:hypothetical protein
MSLSETPDAPEKSAFVKEKFFGAKIQGRKALRRGKRGHQLCQNKRGRYCSRIRSRQIHKKALHAGKDRGCC